MNVLEKALCGESESTFKSGPGVEDSAFNDDNSAFNDDNSDSSDDEEERARLAAKVKNGSTSRARAKTVGSRPAKPAAGDPPPPSYTSAMAKAEI